MSRHVHAYCESERCAVRLVEVTVKLHAGGPKLPQQWRCPACASTLTVHEVQSAAEYDRQQAKDARGSVAIAMYLRDQRRTRAPGVDPRWLTMYPLSVLLDERLPPTPPGWWDGLR
jgi:hypothetical protein